MENRFGRHLALGAALLAALFVGADRSNAFDPDPLDYGHSFVTRAVVSGMPNFFGRTIEPFSATLIAPGQEEQLFFTPDAADQLVLGARSTDFLNIVVGNVTSGDGSVTGPSSASGVNATLFEDEIDGGLAVKGEPDNLAAHCDDENIGECAYRIFTLTVQDRPQNESLSDVQIRTEASSLNLLHKAALLALQETPSENDLKRAYGFAIAARIQTGRSLHTVQDFYAHSSWSDTYTSPTQIFSELGTGERTPTEINARFVAGAACTHNEVSPGVWTALLTAVERASGIAFDIIWAGLLDQARINDGKLKLDWDKSGGRWEYAGVIATQIANPPPAGNAQITSGYFKSGKSLILGISSAPEGKCDHGMAKLGSRLAGINKDTPYTRFAPFPQGINGPARDETQRRTSANPSNEHRTASYQAAEHTKKIFENVINAIGLKAGTDKVLRDKMVELYMGSKPAIAFVVDRTGSMQDIIDGVSKQLKDIAEVERNADLVTVTYMVPDVGLVSVQVPNPNKKYILTTYGEKNNVPDITIEKFNRTISDPNSRFQNTQITSGTSAADIVERLSTITAFGGGDCPEPTMAALLETIKRTPRKSKLYVFTDASSKNATLPNGKTEAQEIERLVKSKRLQVNFSVSGSCSPIDPKYAEIAAISGGLVTIVDHTTDDTSVALKGIPPGTPNPSTVHIEHSSLPPGSSKTATVAVESGAKELVITVTNDSNRVSVFDPSGASVSTTAFLGGAVLKVNLPAPGNWRVKVDGWDAAPGAVASNFGIKAEVTGVFSLESVEYTSKVSSTAHGHETYVTYGEAPPATDVRMTAQLKTNKPTNPSVYTWEAMGMDGSVLGLLDVHRSTSEQYEGIAALQSISSGGTRGWMVRVSGVDESGAPFARMLPTVQTASRQRVSIVDAPRYWVAGAEHTVRVAVENFGSDDTFRLTSSPTLGATPQAASLQIPAQSTAIAMLKIQLPSSVAANATDALKIAVSSAGEASAVVQILSIPYFVSSDTDGDGVPDSVEQGADGHDANFDGNGDGIPDWQQASVISFWSAGHGAYLTASTNAGTFNAVQTFPVDDLHAAQYGYDLIGFQVAGIGSGGSAEVKLRLPANHSASGFGMFGVESGNSASHWYDFNRVGAVGTIIDGQTITLGFQDGTRGDDDQASNGVIRVMGGPVNPMRSPLSVSNGGSSSGGAGGGSSGGGCTIGDPAQRDASLILLALLAAFAVMWRAYANRGSRERSK